MCSCGPTCRRAAALIRVTAVPAGTAAVSVTRNELCVSAAGPRRRTARARRQGVLLALDLSATTFRRIYLNYAWAFGYNLLMVPLAAGALYPPLRFQLPPWVRAPAWLGTRQCSPAQLLPWVRAPAWLGGASAAPARDRRPAWRRAAAGRGAPPDRPPRAPQVAGGAMALSSVSVVCSSLLLRRYRPPPPVARAWSAAAPS